MNSIKGNPVAVLVTVMMSTVILLTVVVVIGYLNIGDRHTQEQAETAVESAQTSWMVATECAKGDTACDAALKAANGNEWGIRYYEDGTAFRN